MTRYDFRCQECGQILEVKASLSTDMPTLLCTCGGATIRYFGAMSASDIAINYGFRSHRYPNKTDRDIAQYQFEHL